MLIFNFVFESSSHWEPRTHSCQVMLHESFIGLFFIIHKGLPLFIYILLLNLWYWFIITINRNIFTSWFPESLRWFQNFTLFYTFVFKINWCHISFWEFTLSRLLSKVDLINILIYFKYFSSISYFSRHIFF